MNRINTTVIENLLAKDDPEINKSFAQVVMSLTRLDAKLVNETSFRNGGAESEKISAVDNSLTFSEETLRAIERVRLSFVNFNSVCKTARGSKVNIIPYLARNNQIETLRVSCEFLLYISKKYAEAAKLIDGIVGTFEAYEKEI